MLVLHAPPASAADALAGFTIGARADTSKFECNDEGFPMTTASIAGQSGALIISMCGDRIHGLDFLIVLLPDNWTDRVQPPAIRTAKTGGFQGPNIDGAALFQQFSSALVDAGWVADPVQINGKDSQVALHKAGATRRVQLSAGRTARVDVTQEADEACTSGL